MSRQLVLPRKAKYSSQEQLSASSCLQRQARLLAPAHPVDKLGTCGKCRLDLEDALSPYRAIFRNSPCGTCVPSVNHSRGKFHLPGALQKLGPAYPWSTTRHLSCPSLLWIHCKVCVLPTVPLSICQSKWHTSDLQLLRTSLVVFHILIKSSVFLRIQGDLFIPRHRLNC